MPYEHLAPFLDHRYSLKQKFDPYTLTAITASLEEFTAIRACLIGLNGRNCLSMLYSPPHSSNFNNGRCMKNRAIEQFPLALPDSTH